MAGIFAPPLWTSLYPVLKHLGFETVVNVCGFFFWKGLSPPSALLPLARAVLMTNIQNAAALTVLWPQNSFLFCCWFRNERSSLFGYGCDSFNLALIFCLFAIGWGSSDVLGKLPHVIVEKSLHVRDLAQGFISDGFVWSLCLGERHESPFKHLGTCFWALVCDISSISRLLLRMGSGVNKPSCTTSGVGLLAAEGGLSVEIEKNRVSIQWR